MSRTHDAHTIHRESTNKMSEEHPQGLYNTSLLCSY